MYRKILWGCIFIASFLIGFSMGPAKADILPDFPANTYVVDTTGVLKDQDIASLNTALAAMDKAGKVVMGVVVMQTAAGTSISELGVLMGEKWKLGHPGKDDGLILAIYLQDHKSNISTGKGISGDIPDITAKHICEESNSYFKEKHYAEGISAIISKVNAKIATPTSPVATIGKEKRTGDLTFVVVSGTVILVILGWFFVYESYRQRKDQEEYARRVKEENERRAKEYEEFSKKRAEEYRRVQSLQKARDSIVPKEVEVSLTKGTPPPVTTHSILHTPKVTSTHTPPPPPRRREEKVEVEDDVVEAIAEGATAALLGYGLSSLLSSSSDDDSSSSSKRESYSPTRDDTSSSFSGFDGGGGGSSWD